MFLQLSGRPWPLPAADLSDTSIDSILFLKSDKPPGCGPSPQGSRTFRKDSGEFICLVPGIFPGCCFKDKVQIKGASVLLTYVPSEKRKNPLTSMGSPTAVRQRAFKFDRGLSAPAGWFQEKRFILPVLRPLVELTGWHIFGPE